MLLRSLLLSFLVAIISMKAFAEPIDKSRIHVLDGDTIRIDQQKPDVQLMGFDAPEIRGARCDAEIDLGAKAARRLRSIIKDGRLEFSFVPCPCPVGKEGTAYCRRGRRCGILKVNENNVGDILIAEKLAVPTACEKSRCDLPSWCQK